VLVVSAVPSSVGLKIGDLNKTLDQMIPTRRFDEVLAALEADE
jgi:hypothetical protein